MQDGATMCCCINGFLECFGLICLNIGPHTKIGNRDGACFRITSSRECGPWASGGGKTGAEPGAAYHYLSSVQNHELFVRP